MKAIRYGLHFATLTVAVVVLWLAKDLALFSRTFNFDFFQYGLIGALHATCIVVSLRDRRATRPIIALCFITLTTVLSSAIPFLGLWGSIVWFPLNEILRRYQLGVFTVYLTGSAIGSSGYWLLVRLFWLKSLRRADWLRTVALCLAATLFSLVAVETLNLSDHSNFLLITAVWWYAFSLSLYWSETSALAKKTTQATVTAP